MMEQSRIDTTMLYAEMPDRLVAEQHRKFSPMRELKVIYNSIYVLSRSSQDGTRFDEDAMKEVDL